MAEWLHHDARKGAASLNHAEVTAGGEGARGGTVDIGDARPRTARLEPCDNLRVRTDVTEQPSAAVEVAGAAPEAPVGRRWFPRLSWWQADCGLAALVWLGSAALSVPPLLQLHRGDAWFVVLLVTSGIALSLVWRRRSVAVMALVLGVVGAVQLALVELPLAADMATLIAMYSGARWTQRTWLRVSVLAGGLAFCVVAALRWVVVVDPQGVLIYVLFLAGFVSVAWFAGDVSLRRVRYTSGLEHQNLVLVRERAQARELAAAAERNAIARELHDVLAHSLAVIAVQAEGAAYAAATGAQGPAGESLATTLQTIADTARDSLAETRRVVFQLRETPPGGNASSGRGPGEPDALTTNPAPDLGDVAGLCARLGDAGREVRLVESGDLAGVTHEVSRAAYRIVQESLTNALKHGAPDAPITVDVALREDRVHVRVVSEMAESSVPPLGTGSGLVGMDERARSVRGHLTAGESDGRFVVEASLPAGGAA